MWRLFGLNPFTASRFEPTTDICRHIVPTYTCPQDLLVQLVVSIDMHHHNDYLYTLQRVNLSSQTAKKTTQNFMTILLFVSLRLAITR